MARTSPNIVITGTPGVGKSSHCTRLAAATGLRHISINDVVKGRACHEGWDVQGECWVVDEEKVRVLPSLLRLISRALDLGAGRRWG